MPIRDAGRSLKREEDSGAQVQQDLERPTAQQIYAQVAKNARQELKRPVKSLAVSGLAGGITMGLNIKIHIEEGKARLKPAYPSQVTCALQIPRTHPE